MYLLDGNVGVYETVAGYRTSGLLSKKMIRFVVRGPKSQTGGVPYEIRLLRAAESHN